MKKALIASTLVLAGAMTGCSSLNTSAPSLPLTGAVQSDVKADIVDGDDRPELLGQMIDLYHDPPNASKAMTNGNRTPAPLGVSF